MPNTARHRSTSRQESRWPMWVAAGLILLLLLYAIAGFLVLPWWLEEQLPEQAQEHLGWDASSRDIAVNPFTLSVTLSDFSANDTTGETVASVRELHLNLSVIQLFTAQIGIDELRLLEPYLRLELDDGGDLNLLRDWRNNSPLATGGDTAETEPGTDDSPGLPLIISNAQVESGKILLRDLRGSGSREFNIAPLEFDLQGVAAFEDAENAGEYFLSASMGDSQTLTWQGTITLLPFHSTGDISLENILAESLWHFVGRYTDYDWRQGRISLQGQYTLSAAERFQIRLEQGQLQLRDSDFYLDQDADGQPALQVGQLDAQGVHYDLAESRLTIETATVADWTLLLSRDAQGELNWVADESDEEDSESSEQNGSGPGLQWRIDDLALDKGTVDWRDASPANPVDIRLAQVDISLTGLTDERDRPVGLTLELQDNGSGRASMNGEFTLNPFTLESAVQLAEVSLPPFEPYLSETGALDLASGTAGFDGYISLDNQQPELTGTVEGSLSLNSVETRLTEPDAAFLNWQSLRLETLRLQLEPLAIDIPSITWVEPEFTYIRLPDGANSISRALRDDEENGEESGEAGDPAADQSRTADAAGPAIRIQQLNLKEAAIVIDDRAIEGGFQTRLHSIGGEVRALSNQMPQKAEIALQAEVDEQGSLGVEGTLGALGQGDTTKLHLSGNNLAMVPLTPYFSRYLGYKVASGNLELEMDYTLEDDQLDGTNTFVLQEFQLGESVQSPAAVDAPVRLGISLLRNRDGSISLELPVSGNLSDPQFSISDIILGAFSNIVARAATAPFSILAGLANFAGGEDDLGQVGFAPGSSELDGAQEERLQQLASALQERPAITLQFRGATAPDWDGPALVLAGRDFQLEGQDLGELVEALESRLRETQSESALEQLRSSRSQDGTDDTSAAWAQTLLEQLAGARDPEPGALRQLADDRAATLREALAEDNDIAMDRINSNPVRMDAEFKGGRIIIPFELGSE